MSITEACAFFEANDPPIRNIEVGFGMNGDELSLGITGYDWSGKKVYDHGFDNVDAWRRIGKSIQGIHIERFGFYSDDFDMRNMTPSAAACIDALYGQIKCARLIEKFLFYVFADHQVPMFDLGHFVESNQSLQHLMIHSQHNLTSDQVNVLQKSIAATQLELLSYMPPKL
jgi:hypothetical protein